MRAAQRVLPTPPRGRDETISASGPSQRGGPRAPRRRAPPARRQAHAPTPPARDAGVRPRAPRVKSPRAARPRTLGLFEDGRRELLASAQDFDADEVTVTVE